MSTPLILAIDQGTTSSRAILFNAGGDIITLAQKELKLHYPHKGWVEQNADDIWDDTLDVCRDVLSQAGKFGGNIAGIGITNQRETALIWNKNTGLPVANAAVWQCQRGAKLCSELKTKGYEDLIRNKTGLLIDPYFSASKLSWIMQNTPGLKEQAKKGELLLGTMDSWLLWKLTGGKVHATDYSNACRTMLFNIHTLDWDNELIELFGLYRNMFPEVRFSDEVAGHTEPGILFHTQKPIAGLIGDSHGALFGQTCFKTGMAKATYGTGSSIMMNIGTKALDAPQG
ncbi:MAG: glycerol kinase, partial [Alphaproteobacteria bacterium]|nr:glycerol kinase [Alphaproteobacteria bacterium]